MPLDPQARAYLDDLAALGIPPFRELGPEQARLNMLAAAPSLAPHEEVASVETTAAGSVPVRIYRPSAAEGLPALVWYHGGGWVIGDLDTHDAICRALANRAGCAVVSVDYRLAPEHRFPAAVEDSWEATVWAASEFPRIAVGGDSAGGNLAAVVALRARDAGLPLAFQLLVYPVTDWSFETASYEECAEGYGLTRDAMQWFWELYLGPRGDGAHPDASPLRAARLDGVAPALVITAEYDPLRDEGEAYAERLRAAGVPVELARYDGQLHGFFRMPAIVDRAGDAIDQATAALQASLSTSPG